MAVKVLSENDLQKKIGVVVGTRPGIIKFSPVIRALEESGADYFIVHTGQHYSYNMDKQFFEELELPEPSYTNEAVRKETLHGAQTAEMIRGMEQAFLSERPAVVIVGGDANTNLAGALAARKLGIHVAHMEAGLRSDDWRMPEEHNRVMIDHISEYLFTPTAHTRENLVNDNVKGEMHIVGNTIVDAVYQNLELAREKSRVLKELALDGTDYFLVTAHREENVDSAERLSGILGSFRGISEKYNVPIIFPVHPRTVNRLKEFDLYGIPDTINGLELIEPVGYLDFLMLMANAGLVLTDSGGIQEETCIMQVPCVTLRDNTERPETVEAGGNCIGTTCPETVLECAEKMLSRDRDWDNPFGDGAAGRKIADILIQKLDTDEHTHSQSL